MTLEIGFSFFMNNNFPDEKVLFLDRFFSAYLNAESEGLTWYFPQNDFALIDPEDDSLFNLMKKKGYKFYIAAPFFKYKEKLNYLKSKSEVIREIDGFS